MKFDDRLLDLFLENKSEFECISITDLYFNEQSNSISADCSKDLSPDEVVAVVDSFEHGLVADHTVNCESTTTFYLAAYFDSSIPIADGNIKRFGSGTLILSSIGVFGVTAKHVICGHSK